MTTPILRASPSTITVTPLPQQICGPVHTPVMLYNADLVNTAYAGYSSDLGPSNGTAIPPLTYTVMDGSRSLWAMTPGANVQVNVTPGGTYQSASAAQIAAQIALSGISFSVPVQNLGFTTVTAGSSWTLPTVAMGNAASYEIVINPVAAANPFVTDITIVHLLNGNITARETFTVSNLPGVANQFVRIRGNLHGNQLLVGGQACNTAFLNAVTSGAFTAGNFLVGVFGYASPMGYAQPRVSVDTFGTSVTSVNFGDLIHAQSTAIPANGNVLVGVLESYVGEAYLNCISNTASMTIFPYLAAFSVANGTSSIFDMRLPSTTANNGVMIPLALGGYLWQGKILNTTATVGTANLNVMARDAV